MPSHFKICFCFIFHLLIIKLMPSVYHKGCKLSSGAAAAIALLTLLGAVLGMLWGLIPPLLRQSAQLMSRLPALLDSLRELLARLQEPVPPGEHGIGLCNVNERLQLYFGAESRLSIESRSNSGTRISFRIPAIRDADALRWYRR